MTSHRDDDVITNAPSDKKTLATLLLYFAHFLSENILNKLLVLLLAKPTVLKNISCFKRIIIKNRLFHRKFWLPKFENRGLRNQKHPLMP